ncbi:MAG: peptidylprolyl isomerase, partial [Halobacteriales archaeon]|nr:peptidylprolyl isomerase [Halobacteriales archaeon]
MEADAGDAEAEDTAGDEEETDGLADGDFVRLEYTIRTVEDSRIVDTTDEQIAEDEGLDTEGRDFDARTLVIGAGHVFEDVEEDLIGKQAGDSGSVTVSAEEAFGEYDPDQVRTVSADRIPEDSRHPGGHVDIDGQHGHVETIIGGRARVDFNHPLAGEDIVYEYEIVGVEEDRTEQARGLLGLYVDAADIEMHIQTDEVEETETDDEGEETIETVEKETLYIESAPQLAMNQQWLFSKQQIASEIMDRTGVDRVIVREILEGGGMGGMFPGMGGMGGG